MLGNHAESLRTRAVLQVRRSWDLDTGKCLRVYVSQSVFVLFFFIAEIAIVLAFLT